MSGDSESPRLGPSSFSELYARHQRGLLAFFMRRTFDAEASVDLVGETFAQAFTGRRRFRGRSAEAEASFATAPRSGSTPPSSPSRRCSSAGSTCGSPAAIRASS
jgi:hypothetical protein